MHTVFDFASASALSLVVFGAIALFYHHHMGRWFSNPLLRQIALGAIFGLGTVLVMLHAVEVGPGFLLDARVLFMGFAGLLAGWPGAVAAMLVAIPTRLLMGGDGALIGSLTLTIAPWIGVAWRSFEPRLALTLPWRHIAFGAVLSLALATILLFPEPQRGLALREALPMLIALNLFGSLWAGWMEFGINRTATFRETFRKRSLTDELTGLGNRLHLTEEIDGRLSRLKENAGSFALICIDFDNFKTVNNTLGHKIGDALLVTIARRLGKMISPQEELVRMAGDEFVVLMQPAPAADVMTRANQLLEAARTPYEVGEYVLLMTASIGVVWAPENGRESRRLLQNAEIAAHNSKRAGRNQVTWFDDRMRDALERKANLSQALRQELETRDGIWLAFQPQFSLRERKLVGAEVLLRWTHSRFGNVSPAEFIPIAESAGLVRVLDRMVFDLAARQSAEWRQRGMELKLSVNISVLSLKVGGIAEDILAILSSQGVPPHLIEVEVTESYSLEDSEEALQNIERLRAAGVSVALDDFGTGHSSLSYLQRLPLDAIKVDRSFISSLNTGKEESNLILLTILAMARSLNLRVVAEGIETEQQLEWLSSENCEIGQGFFFGRPLDKDTFETEFLHSSGPAESSIKSSD